MKKIIAKIILVCIVMVLILTCCTNQDSNTQKDKEQNKEQIEKIEDDVSDDVNNNELETEDSDKDQTTQEVKPNIPSDTTNDNSSKQDDQDNQNNTETTDENGNVVKTFKITAYCPCTKCCGKSDGITASGTKATAGRTVGCNSLPFGTQVEIFGHVYTVEDVGGMKNNVIDIFFDSHQEALNFGVKCTEVIIYQ